MSYKIVGDSCCDYTNIEKNKNVYVQIPLTLDVDGVQIKDDDAFNQQEFLERVAKSKDCPRSACPAPEEYMRAYEDADDIYVVTLSSELSGSYNSAVLAKKLYEEEHGQKNIHIFNSKSASAGQLLICRLIEELVESGLSFSEVITKVESYIEGLDTYFVLETLDFLRKNGRLSRVQALLASALNIKPVMGAENGTIIKLLQARGMNKALAKMVDILIQQVPNTEDRVLAIAHCNCPERAHMLKNLFLEKKAFKDVIIVDTAGVSTMYANDGGIVVAC